MPLSLKGKSKARLEIQWEGKIPVELSIVFANNRDILLYREELLKTGGFPLDLSQIELSEVLDKNEIEILALVRNREGIIEGISETLSIQKCPHPSCGQWSHVREDGYCKHCGRRVRDNAFSYGFPKLEMNPISLNLWNGIEGQLAKRKETREYSSGIYSIGKYEDKNHPRAYVEILEEKWDAKVQKRFLQLQEILRQAHLLDTAWKPPLASFQEEYQRTIWIYYPWLPKQTNWQRLSAQTYIVSDNIDLLTTREIVQVGIALCEIARKVHSLGFLWGGLRLNDLILCRTQEEISIYLRNKEIAWDEVPSKMLLDSCLIPWELFWEGNGEKNLYEVTEVYIIAAILYFLQAKAPNLLSYNAISYHYGLPSLKLFKKPFTENTPQNDFIGDYFESTINQALVLSPQERGYQTLEEFQGALEKLLSLSRALAPQHNYILDAGYSLDVGDEKHEDDLTRNQDAVFATSFTLRKKKWGFFVLCDGISTASVGTGDLASRIIINTFRKWWKTATEEERETVCAYASMNLPAAQDFLNSLMNEANQKIAKEALKLSESGTLENAMIMGSTITVGMIHNGVFLFGWLGDSPIYRISSFGWERLNFEDNEKNARIERGMPLDECFIDGGNALTRCVGAHFYTQTNLTMHFGYTYLYPGEHILVCSDGIPDYIEQEASYARYENYQMLRITSVLQQYETDALCNAKALSSILLSSVNKIGGGYDNLSAIVISILPETSVSFEKSYQKLRSLSPSMKKLFREANLDTLKEDKTLKMPRL